MVSEDAFSTEGKGTISSEKENERRMSYISFMVGKQGSMTFRSTQIGLKGTREAELLMRISLEECGGRGYEICTPHMDAKKGIHTYKTTAGLSLNDLSTCQPWLLPATSIFFLSACIKASRLAVESQETSGMIPMCPTGMSRLRTLGREVFQCTENYAV
ncbi:hypothetical protein BDN72DRAFT_581069 [Pluteus cervinus]|uniref:Uncharacterized protein n=1 Tax=Pluteus cervinus TaxID=181527 RepID=A0ACD3A238_9AGAR|nr:hypothetical protein BDN72DRAFT_581069 [Pluteus cervinus]